MKKRFTATLIGRGPKSAWTFLPIPFDVAATFGTKGRVPVIGTITGFAFRKSLMPEGDGTHAMMVDKELQAGAGAKTGDVVNVVLERDLEERVVEVPPEFEEALRGDRKAREMFASSSYSHRKEYADWIGGAKRPETRKARAEKAIVMLREGRRMR